MQKGIKEIYSANQKWVADVQINKRLRACASHLHMKEHNLFSN